MSDTELLTEIRDLLKKQSVLSAELWDAEDIGTYLKASKNTVINKHSRSPTFPRPVGGGEMQKRWKAEEVKAWAMRRCA